MRNVSIRRIRRALERSGFCVRAIWIDAAGISQEWFYLGVKIGGEFAVKDTVERIREAVPPMCFVGAVVANYTDDTIRAYIMVNSEAPVITHMKENKLWKID